MHVISPKFSDEIQKTYVVPGTWSSFHNNTANRTFEQMRSLNMQSISLVKLADLFRVTSAGISFWSNEETNKCFRFIIYTTAKKQTSKYFT